MALVHADDFGLYGTSLSSINFMLNGIYVAVSTQGSVPAVAASPDGVGVACYRAAGSDPEIFRFTLPTAQNTVGNGLRLWATTFSNSVYPALGSVNPGISAVYDASGHRLALCFVDVNGYLRVINYNSTLLGMTSAPVVTLNAFYHIETKWTFSGTNLTCDVRVEGIPVLSVSGVADSGTGTGRPYGGPVYAVEAGSYCYGGSGSGNYFKDLVIWDGTGTQNNDFLGSVLVTDLTPNADVSLNWTPSTGTTGYPILASSPPDDTVYISAADSSVSPYVGTLTSLPDNVTSVKGLITYVRAAKLDGGDASLQTSLISGTTTGNGADRPITIAQTYWRDIFELDPATSAPWTVSAVNAVEFQLNRTT